MKKTFILFNIHSKKTFILPKNSLLKKPLFSKEHARGPVGMSLQCHNKTITYCFRFTLSHRGILPIGTDMRHVCANSVGPDQTALKRAV